MSNRIKTKLNKGFTLIELMVAVIIFSVIAIISYRTLGALITTKEVVTKAQEKWGSIAKAVDRFDTAWNRSIPLVVRDEEGVALPAVWGKQNLNGKYDAQLELTEGGFIGDQIYGSTPPKRVGFRFVDGKLYMVSWPVLNRIQTTIPQVDLILSNIEEYKVTYYTNGQWQDNWPSTNSGNTDISALPKGLKLYIKMKTGEEITRQWSD